MISRQKILFSGIFLFVIILIGGFAVFYLPRNSKPIPPTFEPTVDFIQTRDHYYQIIDLTRTAVPTFIDHTTIVTNTEIIVYEKPKLKDITDSSILKGPFCSIDKDGYRSCRVVESQRKVFKCNEIYATDALLGGLDPAYPIATCFTSEWNYVQRSKACILGLGNAYIIERDGQYELLDSPKKFKAAFAPIESENEAFSYAIAVTKYDAVYHQETSADYEYFVEKLEDTHVETRGNEYIVRLYFILYATAASIRPLLSMSPLIIKETSVRLIARKSIRIKA